MGGRLQCRTPLKSTREGETKEREDRSRVKTLRPYRLASLSIQTWSSACHLICHARMCTALPHPPLLAHLEHFKAPIKPPSPGTCRSCRPPQHKPPREGPPSPPSHHPQANHRQHHTPPHPWTLACHGLPACGCGETPQVNSMWRETQRF